MAYDNSRRGRTRNDNDTRSNDRRTSSSRGNQEYQKRGEKERPDSFSRRESYDGNRRGRDQKKPAENYRGRTSRQEGASFDTSYDMGNFRQEEQAKASFHKRPDFRDRPVRPDVAEQAPIPVREDELPYLIMGRNAVREAIRSGRSINRILVTPEPDGSLREIISLARDNKIDIRETSKAKLDEMCMPFGHGAKPGNHQGIVAEAAGVEYCDISDILEHAKSLNQPPFVVLLDGIEDPYNLGSIIRSAECAGVHGIVIPKRRSASVTASVVKTSAGAVEYVKIARVSNLNNAIERLKQENIWVAGADMQGTPMNQAALEGPLALVIGSEGSGLSKLVKERCDFLVSIPIFGKIESLNASVAAAVLMYAKRSKDI